MENTKVEDLVADFVKLSDEYHKKREMVLIAIPALIEQIKVDRGLFLKDIAEIVGEKVRGKPYDITLIQKYTSGAAIPTDEIIEGLLNLCKDT